MNYTMSESIAIYLAQNTYLQILLAVRMAVCVLAIVFIIALWYTEGGRIALHTNAKILIYNHRIAMIFFCFSVVVMRGLDLKSFFTFKNVDELMISKLHCLLGQIPLVMSWTAMNLSLCSMAVERTIATKGYRSYEKKNGKEGFILVLIQWLIVIIALAIQLTNTDISDHSPTCYFTSSANNFRISMLLFLMALAEIAALVGFYLLMRGNQRRRKTTVENGTLTEKYQLDENIRATKLMIPMVITHFACLFPFMCFCAVYSFNYGSWGDRPKQSFAIFKETFDWAPYYCLVNPLVVFWRRKEQRKNRKNGLRALGLNQVQPLEIRFDGRTQEQIRHFQLLKQLWETAERPV